MNTFDMGFWPEVPEGRKPGGRRARRDGELAAGM